MKFGKNLSNQIEETSPEWRDKYLCYKELKKQLKLINPKCDNGVERPVKRARLGFVEEGVRLISREERDFVDLLEAELDKFNGFFVEKEEDFIIRLKELQDGMAKARELNELVKVRKEIVDIHGEMVLLENYSALNYTGLVKILKKYDKRTGALIRLPFIQKVLQQPFFTTDLIYKLVKECEMMLDGIFPVIGNDPSIFSDKLLRGPKELAEIDYMGSFRVKRTVSALRLMKEIRSRSSTVSVFSLPPLQSNVLEETWNTIPVIEQLAK
ncbi:hypothetical protein GIB67_017788 [Kingdonia uniflora]|uniref:SPX domain-containing protein n=1 Tax=Kingdonia uniflora TaxID=39325 RepID=A0A7J7MPG5_9MAGN|nr:hypothetical protein GIB67_017788 [Kingdonia uniflora]